MSAKELRELAQQILDCNDILDATELCYEIYNRGRVEGEVSNEGEEVTRG
jgi:hypothetical protein